MLKMVIANNIKKLREINNLSVAEFANKIGTTRQNLYAIEKGERALSMQLQKNICEFLDCNIVDLYNDKNVIIKKTNVIKIKYYKDLIKENFVNFTNIEFEIIEIPERLLELLNIKNYLNVIILKSYEKNMEPTISNNDFLLVDLDNKNILNDKLYIIDENGKLKIKRIKRSNPFNSVVIFQSDNQIDGEYPPYELTLIEAKEMILGQIVFYGRSIL